MTFGDLVQEERQQIEVEFEEQRPLREPPAHRRARLKMEGTEENRRNGCSDVCC